MEGHRRKVVGVSVASMAALIVKVSPIIVGSALSLYVAWWLYKHAGSKRAD